jgi:SAM-dependent methyltransferase
MAYSCRRPLLDTDGVLLTMTATQGPGLSDATELGFLLHKHPDRAQHFDLTVGTAHVVYPEASGARCTAALLLEVDPVALVRGRTDGARRQGRPVRAGGPGGTAGQYVNDRPYSAGSLLAVALGAVFRTAVAGRCDARPELAQARLPLEVTVPSATSTGGPELAVRLFGPLGWRVEAEPVPLDPEFPAWGDARTIRLRLSGTVRVADALSSLYVLLPVLEDAKHYAVSALDTAEVDKLLRAGAAWLAGHPERELITRRYLRHRQGLIRDASDRLASQSPRSAADEPALERLALERLAEVDDTVVERVDDAVPTDPDAEELPEDRPPSLARRRIAAVLEVLRAQDVRTVLDLGCGEGALIAELLQDPRFTRVVGADVSTRALAVAARRLHLREAPRTRADEALRDRLQLLQTALTYRDRRLSGFDAAVLMEVVEHVDPPRLDALERCVFAYARPRVVVVTTPNVEHNVHYPFLAPGELRHRDHRFEWTRAQFRAWADGVARRTGYAVRYGGVGDEQPDGGPPTQLAVLTRAGAA